MTKEPFIAHSEITDEIYIICGREKYPVTEQVIKAMQNTGRLEQNTTSEEWLDRIKQAREEIADRIDNYPDRNISEYEDCLEILDNLIAESNGVAKALEQQPSGIIGIVSPCKEQTTLAEKLRQLEHPTSDDCVSRQAVLDLMQLKMGGKELYKAVYDLPPVTPTFPKGATNGDIIQAMFSNLKGREKVFEIDVTVNKNPVGNFTVDWWNAPYKRGGENEVN